jgi:DNA polymerase I-like protein with 3'-5' exonuclease and polymerase domains
MVGSDVIPRLSKMAGVYLKNGTPFAFDTETTGLEPRRHQLILLQFYQEGTLPVVIDVRRRTDLHHIGHILQPIFDDLECIGVNLKFDYKMFKHHCGAEIKHPFDIKLAEQVIRGLGTSEASKRNVHFGLKDIAPTYGITGISKEERNWFVDLDKREEWFQPIPQEQLAYAARDVTCLFPIKAQQVRIIEDNRLAETSNLEMYALPVMGDMELNGFPVDTVGWREVVEDAEVEAGKVFDEAMEVFGGAILEARAEEYDQQKAEYDAWMLAKETYEAEIRQRWEGQLKGTIQWGQYKKERMAAWRAENSKPTKPEVDTGLPNLNSNKQMSAAFKRMNIGLTRYGQWEPLSTTKDEVLAELEDQYPELGLLRHYSKLHKFTTSFGETLLKFVDPVSSRIFSEFDQYGASTGRMTSKRPNLQQVPSRSNWGTRVRACVKARPGHKILTADYSSVEPRILGVIANDPVLLQLFYEGKDIYSETARMVLGIPAHVNIKKEMPQARKLFKEIMLGLSYGMSAFALSKRVEGVTVEQAEMHIQSFFNLYKGVKAHLEREKKQVLTTGYTRTISGRWRKYDLPKKPVPGAPKEEWKTYSKAVGRIQRQAMNQPIQGSSADITKLAAIFFKRYNITNALLIAVVHDEFVVECPDAEVEEASRILATAMYDAAKYFLEKEVVPMPDVVVAGHWTKE